MSASTNKERGEKALSQLERELSSRERKQKIRPLSIMALSAAMLALIGGGIAYFATRDSGDESIQAEQSESTSTPADTQLPDAEPLSLTRASALPATVTCSYPEHGEKSTAGLPKTTGVSAKGTVNVTLTTNKGDIGLTLDRAASPCTVNAIEHLVKNTFYDNTVCHRLTTNAGLKVLQCGDPTGSGSGGPGFQFNNEYPTDQYSAVSAELNQPVIYPRGTLAMANAGIQQDGSGTNGSQFFLNYGDSYLPPAYTYFGKIDDAGLKTLDDIAAAGVQGGIEDGQPAEQVTIEKATIS